MKITTYEEPIIPIAQKPSIYNIITLVLCILSVYFIMWSFTGVTPFKINPYNSYSLQAQSWLNGRLDLAENYQHLEIAEYNGKYYVSFPPFPSVILLPFVYIFGVQTPDHLISAIIGIIGAIYALKIAYLRNIKNEQAIFFVLFATVASNFLFISTNGYVWFMAQTFSFTLSLASIYYALTTDIKTHPWLSLLLWAFSVGCRPFQIVFFPLIVYLLYIKDHAVTHTVGFSSFLRKNSRWFLAPTIVGLAFLMLNFARFNNPLEFGHNYLPEFQAAKQFDTSYIIENVKRLLRLPTLQDGKLIFPKFDGVAFWLVSPIYISYFVFGIRTLIKKEASQTIKSFILVTGLVLINFILLCGHKTMGGWHFGNRYTIDAIPFIFAFLLMFDMEETKLKLLNGALFLLGLCLNIVGSIAVYNNWI